MGDEVKKRRKKKPNKKQREERRAYDADLFNRAFNMGWEAREKLIAQEASNYIELAERERRKWALRGT